MTKTDKKFEAVKAVWVDFDPLGLGDKLDGEYDVFVQKCVDDLARNRPSYEIARLIKQNCRRRLEVKITNVVADAIAAAIIKAYAA